MNLGKRHSPAANLKVALKLRKHNFSLKIEKDEIVIEKKCEFCGNLFSTDKHERLFCKQSCSTKYLWTTEKYRNNLTSQVREKVKNGQHQGWKSRNVLSYPEKFFKEVLEKNGYLGRFQTNHSVKKRDIGIDCDANYFLDFYFPEFNLGLEIDGKQHNLPERKSSDTIRDAALTKYSYKVYRIKWKNINKPSGQEYIKGEIHSLLEFLQAFIAK